MLRFCARKLINKDLKLIKLHKHNKFKHTQVLLVNFLGVHTNLTFSHVSNLSRKIHTNVHLRARIFKDVENVYAYNILQAIPIADRNLFTIKSPNKAIATLEDFNGFLDQDWRSKSGAEVVEGFKSVLGYCKEHDINISDTRFDKLVDGLMDHIQDLTDSELSGLFVCLSEYPLCESYTAHNFHDMWSALDDACCWKISSWPNETLFLFAEHWYRLHLGKLSDYMFNFIDRIRKRAEIMTKDELVHVFFYLKVHKRHKVHFELHDMLDKFINSMSLEEVAIAAMAFARFETKFKLETTVLAMINKLKDALPNADEICVRRIVEVSKVCNYTVQFVEKIARRVEHLTKAQLVHAFFYINVCRKRYVDFNYESALEKHMNQLSADEMAIIAMGFFKSESPIRIKFLLGQMIERIRDEQHTIHEITLTAILKALRYSSHVLLIDQLMDLLDHLMPEIDRLSNLCCIHIALLGTTLQFFHEKSLEKVSHKILASLSDPNEVRLKDMERLLLALTMFNYNPGQDIFKKIYKELHQDYRRKEYVQYPRCLPSALNFLSFLNIYSFELMNGLLDKDWYTEVYGKTPKAFSRDLFSLDTDIEVECPNYKGNRLDRAFRLKVAKWNTEYTPSWNQPKKLTAADKFYLEVVEAVAKMVQGHQNVYADHVLPNFVKSDIIICKDNKGKYVEPSGFDIYKLGDVMRPTNKNLQWFAVIPVNWNNAARNTKKPLGLINKKCRQLKVLGYEPVLVMWNEFLELNDKEKIKYIEKKIR